MTVAVLNTYTVNTLVRISTVITAVSNGQPVDPTTVTLTMQLPDNTDVDLTSSIVRDGIGLYHADYTPTNPGLYSYQWNASGDAVVEKVGRFIANAGVA